MLRNSLKRNICDISSEDFKKSITDIAKKVIKLPSFEEKIEVQINGVYTVSTTKKVAVVSPSSRENTFDTSKKQNISIETQYDLNDCVLSTMDGVDSDQFKKQKSFISTSNDALQPTSGNKKSSVVRKSMKANFPEQSFTKKGHSMKCNKVQKKETNSAVCSHKNRSYCQIIQSKVVSKNSRLSLQSLNETSPKSTAQLTTGSESHIENSAHKESYVARSSIIKVPKTLNICEKKLSLHNASKSNSTASISVEQSNSVRSKLPCTPQSPNYSVRNHSRSSIKLLTSFRCKSSAQLLLERKLRFASCDESKQKNKNSTVVVHNRLLKSHSELKYVEHRNANFISYLPNISTTSSDEKSHSNSEKQSLNKRLHLRRSFENNTPNKEHFHIPIKRSTSAPSVLQGDRNIISNYKCPKSVISNFQSEQSGNIASTSKFPASSVASSPSISCETFDDYMSDVDMPDVPEVPSLNDFSEKMEANDLKRDCDGYAFVVDTNVFIHHLNFIDKLKEVPLEGYGPPHIYISWIVLRELNGLKGKNFENQLKVREALQYIHHMFDSKHPRFHGQTTRMVKKLPRTYGSKNDDLLLSYCKFLSETLSSSNVCLLTDDKNLCTKAILSTIRVYTTENLFSRVKPDVTICQLSDEYEDDLEIKNNVDLIISEAKYHAKIVLKQFLYESMAAALPGISQSLMTPAPKNLCEILKCYEKYWISVFSTLFERNIKKQFETLIKLFSYRRGFVYSVDDAFAMLIAFEIIFRAIQRLKPSINSKVRTIIKLTDKCKLLRKEDNIHEDPISALHQSSDGITYSVFDHIWHIINSICGMMMDFCHFPHNLVYDKPATSPGPVALLQLLKNAYSPMVKMCACMWYINLFNGRKEYEQCDPHYKELYEALIQFVPSLEIQTLPTPIENFTLACLKSYCDKADNRKKFLNGYKQLDQYIDFLEDCLHPLLEYDC